MAARSTRPVQKVETPLRGEIWYAILNPTKGHEQAGRRPVLILSADEFNRGPADLVIVVPLTSTDRKLPLHVAVTPPEAGLRNRSVAMTEAIRSISKSRLGRRLGVVKPATLAAIEQRLRILLDF